MNSSHPTSGQPVPRLDDLNKLATGVRRPAYQPTNHKAGIVHLGPGAFHRAHQAVYTDEALALSGGDWRIIGISLRSRAIADALNRQNGLYSLIENGADGSSVRIIGSIERVIAAVEDRQAAIAAMADPSIRVITMTVTEKAYGIDRVTGQVDMDDETIVHDLAQPQQPNGVLGLIVESLRLRWQAGHGAPTVLCCDNLPENGEVLKAGVLDFARRTDPMLADWIDEHASFPSSMVDRITPAASEETLVRCQQLIGCDDQVPVETEAFTQWVIEDRFVDERPDWQAAGVMFVPSVAPFEQMKLRMLNGAHSMLAYAGFLSGCTYVRDVMEDRNLSRLVQHHMQAAAATLQPLDGVDFDTYADDLLQRFRNPAIAHETYQIAMDGTEKLPQRLLSPAVEALASKGNYRPFAFAVAAWMRYCTGRTDSAESYVLRDPKQEQIADVLRGQETAEGIYNALTALPGLFPDPLLESAVWRETVVAILDTLLTDGVAATIAAEANRRQHQQV